MVPTKYVSEAVKNCEAHLWKNYNGKYSFPKKAPDAFPVGYQPEIDISEPLNPEEASYYASVIGIMRWMVEIGRIDIATELSLLSSHLAYPREGHMECALHTMVYLKAHKNSMMVFDPNYPDIPNVFKDHDWEDFYCGAKELIPPDMPTPLGREVEMTALVDSDHAGDHETRRSRSGFFVFCNNALIQWLSKKQSTIESGVFGAEFVALKNVMESIRGLRYKLRMMDVPITNKAFV